MAKHKATQNKIDNCLEYIVEFMLENGYGPTRSEVADNFNVTGETARQWINELHGTKRLQTIPRCARVYMIPGVYYVDER